MVQILLHSQSHNNSMFIEFLDVYESVGLITNSLNQTSGGSTRFGSGSWLSAFAWLSQRLKMSL